MKNNSYTQGPITDGTIKIIEAASTLATVWEGKPMQELEEKIRRDGVVRPGDVLKVDGFLNHQCDIALFDRMGAEWARLFAGRPVDKILTIEASGIALACIASLHFGCAPVVFARKSQGKNLDGDLYHSVVHSYTHDVDNNVIVERRMLSKGENVLIFDDFLAKGAAIRGLLEICRQAEVNVQGVGIAIEKGFQSGGRDLRAMGYDVKSLAIVKSMDGETGKIEFE